ncbi:MAG: transglycosylase SLT domain-containing protein [Desulfonatronovibrionaceae bacterium]
MSDRSKRQAPGSVWSGPGTFPVLSILCLVCMVFFCGSVRAETIYFYQDESGVMHFTDTPDSDRFRPFLAVSQKDLSQDQIDRSVARYSRDYGLDADLVHAVIKAESDYNSKAVSTAGAEGLMQIIPGTQKELGLEDPFEADSNIEAGVRYLKTLISRYKEIPLALAAYNAGPSRVDKYGDIPPFRETKLYVSKVLRIYKERKGKE